MARKSVIDATGRSCRPRIRALHSLRSKPLFCPSHIGCAMGWLHRGNHAQFFRRQHLRVFDAQSWIARCGDFHHRFLVSIESHAVGCVSDSMRTQLESSFHRAVREPVDVDLGSGDESLSLWRIGVRLEELVCPLKFENGRLFKRVIRGFPARPRSRLKTSAIIHDSQRSHRSPSNSVRLAEERRAARCPTGAPALQKGASIGILKLQSA
jgi:hypothetical protein